ncbi:glycoside hydrolase [Stemphylium lycopersici]|uniref:glucan 1,3-beta-glucosidase n=1 Tax=Stemphylium lycopersici TaxID=183478 RepID=A0A364N581_STELY|nr:glycoside hydrolase [Stemphylium lycopersici]
MAGGATAAPTPGLISSILGLLTNDINKLLSSLGIKLHNDGRGHGSTVPFHNQCPFNVPSVDLSPFRYHHNINWGKGVNGGRFIDWKTFKANGANLGGWLEKEKTHDPIWWSEVGGDDAPDEWTLCQNLGSNVGVNTLRIPLTYAAFVKVPGSQLYHGNQLKFLKAITDYAILKYNMHVIIGLHSLPGGVNNLDIGEALFHNAWFNNATNLDYSFQAIDGVLNFIKQSGHMNAFTVAPINEASDNFAGFGSAAGLTVKGTDWINTYLDGVLAKIAKVEEQDKRIPMMIQDSFMGASYWAPFYPPTSNIVFDSHVYYFAAAGTYAGFVNPAVCGQAQYIAQETRFPVFVGEWSLQAMYNNTLAQRKTLFDTQRYSTASVDGEGSQREYWSFVDLVREGVAKAETSEAYC